jgi:glutaredoxin
LNINLFLAEGDQIQEELIKKTEQDTVPNIFIKQQHIGLFYVYIYVSEILL